MLIDQADLLDGTIILFVFYISRFSRSRRLDWIFPAIQVCVVVGMYFLDADLSAYGGYILLITVPITFLTTLALSISVTQDGDPDSQAKTKADSTQEKIDPALSRAHVLREQVRTLTDQLQAERYRNSQLTLLNELSQQLETELDPPVSAQLAVNTLERAMETAVVALYLYMPEEHEFIVLASAGSMTSLIPPGYRQDAKTGMLGRLLRSRKTSVVNDTRLEPDFFRLENDNTLSAEANWTKSR